MKKIFFLLIISGSLLFSQEVKWQWTFSNNGSGSINAWRILPFKDGDLLIIGTYNGSVILGDYQLNTSASFELFMARISSKGKCLWAKAIDKNYSTSSLIDCVMDNFDNAIILGLFGDELNLLKMNPLGQVTWKNYVKIYSGGWQSIAVDASNNIYCAVLNTIKKYNSDGQLVESKTTEILYPKHLVIDSNGNRIIVSLEGNPNNPSGSAISIYDKDLIPLTKLSFPTVFDLILIPNNSISIACLTNSDKISIKDSTVYFPFSKNGTGFILDYNYYTKKITNLCSITGGEPYIRAIRADQIGNKFLIGDFTDSLCIGPNTFYSKGSKDIFVINYNNGKMKLLFQGGSSLYSPYSDLARDLALTNHGFFYTACDYMGEAAFGDTTINSASQWGWSLAINKFLIDSITNVNKTISPATFKLYQNYPNPFNPTTTINYSIPKQSYVTIKIYDALGREVLTLISEIKPIGNYETKFNADGLSSGIYFYQIKTDGFIQTKKMVLLR